MILTNVAFFALFALVIQNTAVVVFLKLSYREGAQPYSAATVVLTVEFIKFIVCSCVVWYTQSIDILLSSIARIRGQWILIIPSVLYVVQNNLLFYGAQRLSPIVYIVCTQTKILTTAVVSRILLGTKLSARQHVALVILVYGVILVQGEGVDKKSSPGHPSEGNVFGVSAVLCASLTSATAGIVLEKVYKSTIDSKSHSCETPIWTRNVQLSLISLPFAFGGCLFARNESVSFFGGYDIFVACVILLQAAGGIIIGYVLKFANNILKCIAISISICCCAAYSVATNEMNLTPSLVLGVIIVNCAVSIFSLGANKSIPVKPQGGRFDDVCLEDLTPRGKSLSVDDKV